MEIIVNGKSMQFDAQSVLSDVLDKLSLQGKVMAAAINMEVIKQTNWDNHMLKDGDKLELLDFVGGG